MLLAALATVTVGAAGKTGHLGKKNRAGERKGVLSGILRHFWLSLQPLVWWFKKPEGALCVLVHLFRYEHTGKAQPGFPGCAADRGGILSCNGIST